MISMNCSNPIFYNEPSYYSAPDVMVTIKQIWTLECRWCKSQKMTDYGLEYITVPIVKDMKKALFWSTTAFLLDNQYNDLIWFGSI